MIKVFLLAYKDEINAIKTQTQLYRFDWNHHGHDDYLKIYFSFEYLVFIVETNIGKANAAASVASLLSLSLTGLIFEVYSDILKALKIRTKKEDEQIEFINLGFACGLTPELKIGDIVHVSHVKDNDFDLTPFGYTLGQVPSSTPIIKLASKPKKILNLSEQKKFNNNFYIGGCLTGNVFCNQKTLLNNPDHSFLTYDMELYALAQIFEKHSIKIKSYKIISDVIHDVQPLNEQLINNTKSHAQPVLFNYFQHIAKSKWTSKVNYRCINNQTDFERISIFFKIELVSLKKS